MQTIDIDAATMNVSDVDEAAKFFRISGAVEHREPAVRGLLVAVVGDRSDFADVWRKRAGLTLIMSAFDEVKEMIVGPMTRFDYRAAFEIPRESVWIAGAFGDNLKFACDWMKAPKRAIEFENVSAIGDLAFVEHAVQSIKPTVRSPSESIRKFVRVCTAESGENNFATDRLSVLFAKEKQIGRVQNPHAAVARRHAGWNV